MSRRETSKSPRPPLNIFNGDPRQIDRSFGLHFSGDFLYEPYDPVRWEMMNPDGVEAFVHATGTEMDLDCGAFEGFTGPFLQFYIGLSENAPENTPIVGLDIFYPSIGNTSKARISGKIRLVEGKATLTGRELRFAGQVEMHLALNSTQRTQKTFNHVTVSPTGQLLIGAQL